MAKTALFLRKIPPQQYLKFQNNLPYIIKDQGNIDLLLLELMTKMTTEVRVLRYSPQVRVHLLLLRGCEWACEWA